MSNMEQTEITDHLQNAVAYLERHFNFHCTLSEVLSLRRFIRETERTQGTRRQEKMNPALEGIARLFDEYYDINFVNLFNPVERGGREYVQYLMAWNPLIAGSDTADFMSLQEVSEEFKEYLFGLQRKIYLP